MPLKSYFSLFFGRAKYLGALHIIITILVPYLTQSTMGHTKMYLHILLCQGAFSPVKKRDICPYGPHMHMKQYHKEAQDDPQLGVIENKIIMYAAGSICWRRAKQNHSDLKILGCIGDLTVKIMKVLFKCTLLWLSLALTFSSAEKVCQALSCEEIQAYSKHI